MTMWKDLSASWAILLGIGFMMLALGLQGTLIGVRATLEGFSTFITGIIMSGYFIGIFIGSMLAPILIARVGHIRVFSALASLASISILMHGVFIDPLMWMLMRIITGICFAGLYVVTESWLNDRASNQTRGKVLSVYMVIITLGMGSGQFLLNLAEPGKIELFILVSVIISFGLIPVLLTAKPAPAFETSSKMSLIELYHASPLALIGNGLTGVAHGTIFGLGPIYASVVLVDVKKISLFMACFLIGGLITQWPIGHLSDRVSRRLVMSILSIISIVCCVVSVIISKDGWLFYLFILGLGGSSMPMYSLCVAHANDRLEPHQLVGASGSLMMVSGIGLSTGPIIIAYFMDIYGEAVYFWGIASASFLVLVFTLIRIGARAGPDVKDQSHSIATGAIGTPIAEFNAPDAVDYAEEIAHLDYEVEDVDDVSEVHR